MNTKENTTNQPNFSWLNTDPETAAFRLLGAELERIINNEIIRVKIVEVETYDETDPASHTFHGKTPRNEIMFSSAGHLYVYFTYGMHYCCNVVCGKEGFGAGILIRAVEPISGIDLIEKNRKQTGKNATNGPAKTCQALEIDKKLNGHFLNNEPLTLIKNPPLQKDEIIITTRIGIKEATKALRRYYIKDNIFVSKK